MTKEEEIIAASFAVVKDYVTAKFSEFGNVEMMFCPEAEMYYEMSVAEQMKQGKRGRVFAHVFHLPAAVCVSHPMAALSEEQRQGILIHEFGHLYAERHPEPIYDIGEMGIDGGDIEDYQMDPKDDADADLIVIEKFGVNMHYDEDDIEYVQLPLGSEEIPPDEELTSEEMDAALETLDDEGEEEKYEDPLSTENEFLDDDEELPPDSPEGELNIEKGG